MDDLIQALPKLLRAAGESEEVAEAAAFVAWRRTAGEALRTCAFPFRLYRKTLVVAVPDETWRKQLETVSSQFLFRINSVVGQALVTFIEFRVDPATVARERARLGGRAGVRHLREEAALDRASAIAPAASAIRDEALRRRFLIAAGSCLDRQKP